MNKRSFWREVFSFIKIFLIALILTIPIKYFIIEPYVVVGASMSPNFETGHYLIVNKLKNTSKIERGDILVFSSPKDRHISPKLRFTVYFDQRDKYIKRVIGLPFETIKLEGNYVFLKKQNEKEFIKLNEPYLKELGNYRGVTTTLKYDEFFMLGDNRNWSFDSEEFGPIRKNDIMGEPVLRLIPFDKIDLFPSRYDF